MVVMRMGMTVETMVIMRMVMTVMGIRGWCGGDDDSDAGHCDAAVDSSPYRVCVMETGW